MTRCESTWEERADEASSRVKNQGTYGGGGEGGRRSLLSDLGSKLGLEKEKKKIENAKTIDG